MKLLLLLALFSACGRTQPTDNECFRKAYRYISDEAIMRVERPFAMEEGVHLWNKYTDSHIRFHDETIPEEEKYCFNILGDWVNVPISLKEDGEWIGLEHLNTWTGKREIFINPTFFLDPQWSDAFIAHVMAHEIGHSLGMYHLPEYESILFYAGTEFLVPTASDYAQWNSIFDDGWSYRAPVGLDQ